MAATKQKKQQAPKKKNAKTRKPVEKPAPEQDVEEQADEPDYLMDEELSEEEREAELR